MIRLKTIPEILTVDVDPKGSNDYESSDLVSVSYHYTFHYVHDTLKKFQARFPHLVDNTIFNDMLLFYLLATKKYLDHRNPSHLFRLILSIHFFQKKLLKSITLFPNVRHLEIRWLPTSLSFPFSSKSVLGLIIGFNEMDRYELFDEENILLAIQKHLPELKLVNESFYCHNSQHRKIKLYYLEVEKKNMTKFSFDEINLLKDKIKCKIEKSIQVLTPNIFMGSFNDEEVYRNMLTLSQEFKSLKELPQVSIIFEQQTGKEIIFQVTLVQPAPYHRFSLRECIKEAIYIPQKSLIVRHLDDHPIEANFFRIRLPRQASFLRSDGSLDFYSARKKVATLLEAAIGKFRDYNGGIIVKQQELFKKFKEHFQEIDAEIVESFFYSIAPLNKQVLLDLEMIISLFTHYLENRQSKLSINEYAFKRYREKWGTLIFVHGSHFSVGEIIKTFIQEYPFKAQEMVYSLLDNAEGIFFNCIFLDPESKEVESFIQEFSHSLEHWKKKIKNRQVLRIGLEYSVVSLDPRIGGDGVSGSVVRLLFEGLTRFDQKGNTENGMANSIEISPDKTQYIFKLRSSLWNDGSPVSAYDFEYAWKKILSPNFNTSFAYTFYPIKNAKAAKKGKVSADQIGVQALNEWTLKVELESPTSYFLQLTANPLYSPVHRLVDQQHPEWPYQSGKDYPSNGPFQLKINQPNQGYQLVKNPFYWDSGNIELDQITLIQMSSSLAFQSFQKNEIDWIGSPFGNLNPAFVTGNSAKIMSIPNVLGCWLVFNTSCFPFNNLKLRQAFAHAIQRDQLIKGVSSPLNASYSPLPPQYGTKKFPDGDLERARQLLEESLREMNLQKEDLPTFNLIFHEGGREELALAFQAQIASSLKVNFNIKPLPWSSLFNNMSTGNFQIGLIGWVSWANDPAYVLNPLRNADLELNFSKWENSEFQHWLSLSEQDANPFQHSFYVRKTEEILCREVPLVPLVCGPLQSMVVRDLQIATVPLYFFDIAKSYFKE